jgi:hypothetical protein
VGSARARRGGQVLGGVVGCGLAGVKTPPTRGGRSVRSAVGCGAHFGGAGATEELLVANVALSSAVR